MNITFRKLIDNENEYKKLHKWCSQKFVYEWFEQRILSYEEICEKYKNKLSKKIQTLLIIQYDNEDIGLLQFYKFPNDIILKNTHKYNNIYEYDLFIGDEKYLSKGIGKDIIHLIDEIIYNSYNADAIILRPFKRNIRAIKCYEKCDYKIINEYQGKDTIGNPEIISVFLKEKH